MHLNKAIEAFDLALVGVAADATRRWYALRLRSLAEHFGEETDLGEMDVAGLRAWRAGLVERDTRWEDHPSRPARNSGLSPHTVHGYVRAVRRFFAWLAEEELLERSPAARLRLPALPEAEPKHVTAEDRNKILQAAKNSGPRDYAIVCFLSETACRLGELATLHVEDLDLARRRAVVRGKGKGGRGKVRAVRFAEQTANALSEYLADRRQGPVWLGQRGPLTANGIYQVIRRLAKRAGVDGKYNPHAWRHGWAKHALVEGGAPLGLVSQYLGHSHIDVTHESYGLWTADELDAAASRYSPLNSHGDT